MCHRWLEETMNYLLYVEEEVLIKEFSPGPFVSFRCMRKLKKNINFVKKLVCILVRLNVSQSFQAKVLHNIYHSGGIITKNIIRSKKREKEYI